MCIYIYMYIFICTYYHTEEREYVGEFQKNVSCFMLKNTNLRLYKPI